MSGVKSFVFVKYMCLQFDKCLPLFCVRQSSRRYYNVITCTKKVHIYFKTSRHTYEHTIVNIYKTVNIARLNCGRSKKTID